MDDTLLATMHKHHLYSVAELARSVQDMLAKRLGIPEERAERLIREAGLVLEKLRRRSECRKFMRDNLIPRKGRSYSKILTALKEAGVSELSDVAKTNPAILIKAGIGEMEAGQILSEARNLYHGQVLREIGIPAVSLKKYLSAGITTPEMFCTNQPAALAEKTGMSLSTVTKHVAIVCKSLNKPEPAKISRTKIERGKKELLAIRGITASIAERLLAADIIDAAGLLSAEAKVVAARTEIPVQKIKDFQAIIQKKKDTAIIQI
jgi:DNA topoisomerase-1